jgi:hypothetical protein
MLPQVVKVGTFKNYFDIYYVKLDSNTMYTKVAMLKDTFDLRVIQYIIDNKNTILLCEVDSLDITQDFLAVSFYFFKHVLRHEIIDYLSNSRQYSTIHYYDMESLEKNTVSEDSLKKYYCTNGK